MISTFLYFRYFVVGVLRRTAPASTVRNSAALDCKVFFKDMHIPMLLQSLNILTLALFKWNYKQDLYQSENITICAKMSSLSIFLFSLIRSAVGTYWFLLKPGDNTYIMKDMLAFQDPDNFAFGKSHYTDRAFFFGLPYFHFLYFVDLNTQPIQCILYIVLIEPKLDRIFQH